MKILTFIKKINKEIDAVIDDYQYYPEVLFDFEEKCKTPWELHWRLLKMDFDDYQGAAYTCGYIEALKWVKKQIERGRK